ncbi:hypothetical protein EDB81DRAFT_772584 [Dactylonectria macrodidyma]|uniref:SGNH hydrolase-type esterase domain-containing protein n=1 Tax=Dactylonectria macrodidyma TaxID=307937 RepID=A0A9P9JN58_9HYPO|nr:hypothetical protein EDB81DRAFT_772584 [Dactylonectria macrodidyma]
MVLDPPMAMDTDNCSAAFFPPTANRPVSSARAGLAGSMSNRKNEGWRGYGLGQADNKARQSVSTLLPTVFTINAGSNDSIQDFRIQNSGQRMADMLEYLSQASPTSSIILSTMLVNADKEVNSRVLRANDQLREPAKLKELNKRE